MRTPRNCAITIAVAAALGGAWSGAYASAFQLIEQTGSGMGLAYAGQAAAAADASTVFYNPAGMGLLPRAKQLAVVFNAVQANPEFSNTASTTALGQTSLGGNGGVAGGWSFFPNFYFAMPLDEKWDIGIGVTAPFGLKSSYDPRWAGRFYAILSKLETYNINPSVSYKFNDQFSIGGGINYQHTSATLTNAVNYSGAALSAGGPAMMAAIGGAGVEGVSTLNGSDGAWGWNIGAMWSVDPNTRVGLSYRSSVSYHLTGNVSFANRPTLLANALPDGAIVADLKMPAIASLAVFTRLNPKVDLLADLSWTEWSNFGDLTVYRSNGALLNSTPHNWKSIWRVGAGINYHYNNEWTGRVGTAFDNTPVADEYRTPRIPDSRRFWLAFGAQYKVSQGSALDFGFAHVFMKDSTMSLPGPGYPANSALSFGRLVGNYTASVNMLTLQYSHTF